MPANSAKTHQMNYLVDWRPDLAKSFVEGDADACRKVQASDLLVRHRYCQARFRIAFKHLLRQPASLGTEDETVVITKIPRGVRDGHLRREIDETGSRQRGIQIFEGQVSMQIHFIPVIQSRSLKGSVVHPKTGNAYDVKSTKCCCAESGNISGVRRDLGLEQRYMQH